MISIFLAIAYFFFVTSFFQGWQNSKLFDAVPDLMIFVLMFSFFIYAFRIKEKRKRLYLLLGTGAISLARLIEIPLQEYQVIVGSQGLPSIFWTPTILLNLVGLLLLLLLFGRLRK